MRLNKQVCRNHARLPSDFYFELTLPEAANLKSQYATSSWGGRRKLPNAFTEHGAIMAASVLNSERAIEISFKFVHYAVELWGNIAVPKEIWHHHRNLSTID